MMELKYIAEQGCEPVYGNAYAAGLDLRAKQDVNLTYGIPTRVGTGLCVEIPPNHVGLVRGRSSLAFKRGIWSFDGTIDEDYRGEISLLLLNLNPASATMTIDKGERVCQLVIVPVVRLQPTKLEELSTTERGQDGFGSTGAK
jgi:dUTP pyrophosphatase